MRILIADDHAMIRHGLRAALAQLENAEVVAEAEAGADVVRKVAEHHPDLLILDLHMPGPPPEDVIRAARAAHPALKVLVHSAHAGADLVSRLSAVHVDGYVLKDEALTSFLQAVRTVRDGAVWFSGPVAQQLMARPTASAGIAAGLNAREREILALVAAGYSNRVIASKLSLAQQTVRNYVSALYDKLQVSSRVDAAVWAHQWLSAGAAERSTLTP